MTQPESEYTALGSIFAPDSLVAGYRRGDPVPAGVVENWGLAVGVDVMEGPLEVDGPQGSPMPRPDEGANRAAWEAYAVAHGMSADDAAGAPLEDLMAERDAKGKPVDRPADNAKKADWVAYVKKLGADKVWADDDTTTRADLQAWQPGTAPTPVPQFATGGTVPGDSVAVAAAEATRAP